MTADGAAAAPTAESIARLPPKLRARLLQRGILKQEDVLRANGGANDATGTPGGASSTASPEPGPAAAEAEATKQDAAPTAPSAPSAQGAAPGTPPAQPTQPPPGTPPLVPTAEQPSRPPPGTPPLVPTAEQPSRPPPGTPPLAPAEEQPSQPPPGTPPLAIPGTCLEQQSQLAPGVACETATPVAPASAFVCPMPLGSPSAMFEAVPSAFAKSSALTEPPVNPAFAKSSALVPPPVPLPLGAAFAKKPAAAVPDALAPNPAPVSTAPMQSMPAPVQKTVYASAPVLKRPAPEPQQEGADPAAKRPAVTPSPAALRAAAAKAQQTEAPVWVYKDGKLAQAGVPANDRQPQDVLPQPLPPKSAPAEPPLPPGWVRVPHEDDHYYWNTETNEVSWEHPLAPPAANPASKKADVFREEHRVLWTDVGKIIGRQGINLKIIKASIGCTVKVPRQGKGKGKGKDDKGKGKGKGKAKAEVRRGIGNGEEKLTDDLFATLVFEADTARAANGGKRCVEVMLGYGRNVERALCDLGVELKMPNLEEMTDGKAKVDKQPSSNKDGVDPMDPAAYSDAPVGTWSAGMAKRDASGRLIKKGQAPLPRDSSSANAERF